MAEKNKRKKRRRKKRNKKLRISAAAFISAAAIVVFCFYYIYFKTPYFDIVGVNINGNYVYSDEYLLEKSCIELDKKIFSIDRSKVKDNLMKEVYLEKVRVVYELPGKIYLDLVERVDKYQILYKNEYIIIDKYGIVLRTDIEKSELLTIESYTDVVYNEGSAIQFEGIENSGKIFEATEFLSNEYGNETIKGFTVDINDSLIFETDYKTTVKIDLNEDINYQIVFAMKIINERLNNNLTVADGLIDFTKGDSPVFAEDFKLEEFYE